MLNYKKYFIYFLSFWILGDYINHINCQESIKENQKHIQKNIIETLKTIITKERALYLISGGSVFSSIVFAFKSSKAQNIVDEQKEKLEELRKNAESSKKDNQADEENQKLQEQIKKVNEINNQSQEKIKELSSSLEKREKENSQKEDLELQIEENKQLKEKIKNISETHNQSQEKTKEISSELEKIKTELSSTQQQLVLKTEENKNLESKIKNSKIENPSLEKEEIIGEEEAKKKYFQKIIDLGYEEEMQNQDNNSFDYNQQDQRAQLIIKRVVHFFTNILKLQHQKTEVLYTKREIEKIIINKIYYTNRDPDYCKYGEIISFLKKKVKDQDVSLFLKDLKIINEILTSSKYEHIKFYKLSKNLIPFSQEQIERIQYFLIDVLKFKNRHDNRLYQKEEIKNARLLFKALVKNGFIEHWDYIGNEIKKTLKLQNLRKKIIESGKAKRQSFSSNEIIRIKSFMMDRLLIIGNDAFLQEVKKLDNTDELLNFFCQYGDEFFSHKVLDEVTLLVDQHDLLEKIKNIHQQHGFTEEEITSFLFMKGSFDNFFNFLLEKKKDGFENKYNSNYIYQFERYDEQYCFIKYDKNPGRYKKDCLSFFFRTGKCASVYEFLNILNIIFEDLKTIVLVKETKKFIENSQFTNTQIEKLKLYLRESKINNSTELKNFIINRIDGYYERQKKLIPAKEVILEIQEILQVKEQEEEKKEEEKNTDHPSI